MEITGPTAFFDDTLGSLWAVLTGFIQSRTFSSYATELIC